MTVPHAHGAPSAFSSQALVSASFALCMDAPRPHAQARAILLRCFWIHDDPGQTRVALALADAGASLFSSTAPPGVLAAAFADRARHELLLSGARVAPSYLDDFPSSPAMASDDICSVNCAVRFGLGQAPHDLDAALGRALDSMFNPALHFRRHAKTSLSGPGELEKRANALIVLLRSARASRRPPP